MYDYNISKEIKRTVNSNNLNNANQDKSQEKLNIEESKKPSQNLPTNKTKTSANIRKEGNYQIIEENKGKELTSPKKYTVGGLKQQSFDLPPSSKTSKPPKSGSQNAVTVNKIRRVTNKNIAKPPIPWNKDDTVKHKLSSNEIVGRTNFKSPTTIRKTDLIPTKNQASIRSNKSPMIFDKKDVSKARFFEQ